MTCWHAAGTLPRMLTPPFPSLAAFGLLFAALLLALHPSSGRASQFAGAFSLLCALIGDILSAQALPALLPVLLLILARSQLPSRLQPWLPSLIAMWALATSLHLLPGFSSLIWQEDFGRSGNGLLRWHYDKGLAALILLWALQPVPPVRIQLRHWALLAGCLAFPALAWLLGLARPDPRWLPGASLWLLGNLFLTVYAEEAFFRGWLQGSLQTLLAPQRYTFALALACSSLVFGLVHLPWGLPFATLSALAGLFYGWMAGPQRNLALSSAAHFLTNAGILLLMKSPLG
ncbi:CPBP family intramembrane glutamic endopeptidase [Uliginosibacterium sp. 31-12]|uniref:CPBP family intramembrane glutamic endopeptidase n=1 Tax=Uliginosibacterium sp. 31-12 TaxID=3062781 RepID=UPI0026E3B115|nr:CPBP family intramembrane glutamic endopeptidase [Uliginosibacterium sp. 31-12]MDO6385045.1 CPBP family intramembrane metalloprotease [Uliginosibacterium sp. 31-12]